MKRLGWLSVRKVLLVAGIMLSAGAQADFELVGPDGQRYLLKDNGTWQAVDAMRREAAEGKSTRAGDAVLTLERKIERGNNCRFVVRLVNNLPYEITSLVPYYAAYRANSVIYDTVPATSAFTLLRPGSQQDREFEFTGIACNDIVRVQVTGGDRCVMGDLTKFSDAKGQCLARLRVVASDLVRFDR